MKLLFLLRILLAPPDGNGAASIVRRSLMHPFSFRVPKGEGARFGRVWIWMRRTVGLVLRRRTLKPLHARPWMAVDEAATSGPLRMHYLHARTGEEAGFLALEDLAVRGGLLQRLGLLLQVAALYVVLAPWLLFGGERRASIGLIPYDMVRLALMDQLLRGSGVRRLVWFNAYEKGTALFAWYFMRQGLELYILPSPNPVRNFYRHTVCSTFVLTAPFQEEEYAELRKGWVVERTVHWPMFGGEELAAVAGRATTPRTVGFLSSGNWIRARIGKPQISDMFLDAEDTALRWCLSYVAKRPDVRLSVLLHPVEKRRADRLAACLDYYASLGFAREAIVTDVMTNRHPELIDVGVCLYSSALFERMFAGYKGVFAQPDMPHDYFMHGAIDRVVAHDEEGFHAMLDDALARSAEDFFAHHGLEAYRWDHALWR